MNQPGDPGRLDRNKQAWKTGSIAYCRSPQLQQPDKHLAPYPTFLYHPRSFPNRKQTARTTCRVPTRPRHATPRRLDELGILDRHASHKQTTVSTYIAALASRHHRITNSSIEMSQSSQPRSVSDSVLGWSLIILNKQ
jgi:hypothetical protein